jgi:N-acetylmuramoyl-L-alanine amidase
MALRRWLTLSAVFLLSMLSAAEFLHAQEAGRAHGLAQGPRTNGGNESRSLKSLAEVRNDNNSSRNADSRSVSGKARLTAVRFFSTDSYTRVVMELSRVTRYETHRLKEDPSKNLPPRLYVDIVGVRVDLESKEPISVRDGLLRQVRVGQFSQDVARVVLDLTSVGNYNAFMLPDPYRLVIEIQSQKANEAVAAIDKNRSVIPSLNGQKSQNGAIRKIVLDPGHGGSDPGATGVGGILEKDIVLSVAKKLARKLKADMGIEVVLTRTDDRFVPLEARTAIANAENADLFISLHTNASPHAHVRGLETYYLDNTDDEASVRLAARENGVGRKEVSDLQFILSDMTQNMKLEDSISLAHRLHGSLVTSMSKKMGDVKDLGVKKALFYVLVGARMPSVLLEMFFITNKREGRAISQDRYQDAVVDALYGGIQKFGETMVSAKTL